MNKSETEQKYVENVRESLNEIQDPQKQEGVKPDLDSESENGTTADNDQKMHGAFFGPDYSDQASTEAKINELMDQIQIGLDAYHATNLEKLRIAREYGPVALALKKLVPHGQFQSTLKKRFPKTSYDIIRRWMIIARHEEEVAVALEKYPGATWGPVKMIKFLKGLWNPESDSEDGAEYDDYVTDDDDCENTTLTGNQVPQVSQNASAKRGVVIKKRPKVKKSKKPGSPSPSEPEDSADEPEDSADEPEDSADEPEAGEEPEDSGDELDADNEIYTNLDNALVNLDDALLGDWPDDGADLSAILDKRQECQDKLAAVFLKAKELLADVEEPEANPR